MDLYSIVIPTYNRLELLKECVASVMAQTYTHWECIIVNDGSTDGTREWLERINNEKIRVLNITHGERSNARNRGLEIASGNFIQFVDDDDLIARNYLSDFVQARAGQPQDVIIRCGMDMFWANGPKRRTPNYNPQEYQHPIQFLTKEMCGTGCLSIPQTAFRDNKFDVRWPHWQDTHLFVRLAAEYRFLQIPKYNYLYRQHEGMGTRSIFTHQEYTDKRLSLTLDAMEDIKNNYPSVNRFIGPAGWSRIIANKYLNFSLETANLGKKSAWKYLWSSIKSGVYFDKITYYLRVPYFILRSKF